MVKGINVKKLNRLSFLTLILIRLSLNIEMVTKVQIMVVEQT